MGTTACCCEKADDKEIEVHDQRAKSVPASEVPMSDSVAADWIQEKGTSQSNIAVYKIVLDRSSGDRLGIDVDQDGNCLLIKNIERDGLVALWNQEHSTKVSIGDWIVEVNGIRDDVQRMVNECKKTILLRVVLTR
mmetsp:Transcript_31143/g.71112  ORF Transcript_31143/g.71112 Transcript_31143/m.71112 type:complete len:136 (+) Transcript_31143:37-444(+)